MAALLLGRGNIAARQYKRQRGGEHRDAPHVSLPVIFGLMRGRLRSTISRPGLAATSKTALDIGISD